jgi:hypothetical protein
MPFSGVQISADALFQRAARLPRVEIRRPACVIGRSTVGSMHRACSTGMSVGRGPRPADARRLDSAGGLHCDRGWPADRAGDRSKPSIPISLRAAHDHGASRLSRPAMTADEYCREIETYLCRKNDGHLIRIVGPSFDRVTGWGERGVPIKVAFRGIDRYFERYYTRGPRRRPVRIDFCEADVLDAFDEWRRAVGMLQTARAEKDKGPGEPPGAEGAVPGDDGEPGRTRARASLPAHVDRVIVSLRRTSRQAESPGARRRGEAPCAARPRAPAHVRGEGARAPRTPAGAGQRVARGCARGLRPRTAGGASREAETDWAVPRTHAEAATAGSFTPPSTASRGRRRPSSLAFE